MAIKTTSEGALTITCGVNLQTNERTIHLEISEGSGKRPFLTLEMTPKDFAETLCSHIARPAKIDRLA